MLIDLKDKVALVTGAGTGIGAAVAKALADAGASVAVAGLASSGVEQVAAAIGGDSSAHVADVSRLTDMEALCRDIQARHGRLDIVVANAGVGDNAPLGGITEAQFDRIIGTNLKGVLFTVQAALPLLQSGASVIVIGSTASIDPPPSMSVYGASKAGVRALVAAWIKDIQGRGIRINVLSPGGIDTPSLRKALEDGGDDSKIKALESRSPLGRIGRPEEIGNVVTFLASEASSYVHGVELFVDGGMRV